MQSENIITTYWNCSASRLPGFNSLLNSNYRPAYALKKPKKNLTLSYNCA
jgi:hypothetical protein